MKTLSPAYLAHIRQPTTTIAICCRITKKNDDVVLGTTHDRDIEVTQTNIGMDLGSPPFDLTGVYRSGAGVIGSDMRLSSDMSVSNMEVQGALRSQVSALWIPDLTVADIEAGLYDAARVTTFKVNYQDPDDFQDILSHGFLGEINRTAEGEYRAEIRGLTQALQQSIGRTAGDRCDVEEFGNARCKFDVAAATVSGTVASVTSRRAFTASLSLASPPPDNGYFNLGKLTMLTGENAGFTRQVRNDSVGNVLGAIDLLEEFPATIAIGDTFLLEPGCDRRYETCRDVHNNLINMRAPGIFTPLTDEIIRSP